MVSTLRRHLAYGAEPAGKEVAARLLHAWSTRADKPFVTVNSARITPERFEHELFGEEQDGREQHSHRRPFRRMWGHRRAAGRLVRGRDSGAGGWTGFLGAVLHTGLQRRGLTES